MHRVSQLCGQLSGSLTAGRELGIDSPLQLHSTASVKRPSSEPTDQQQVFIASAVRTPIGSFNGSLSSFHATALGALAAKAAIERAGLKPEEIEEAYFGNVLSAGLGQAPARQATLGAGLPPSCICTTINKVCSSGMKAVVFGAQSIILRQADIVIAGGFESMSRVPYYLENARVGYRMGHASLVDGMIKDGLWDVYNDFHMGSAAELSAKSMKISREEQDSYAASSYKRAIAASESGYLASEIVPVKVVSKTGQETIVKTDESYKKVDFAKLPLLKPAFSKSKDATVTAGNASSISDGAAALVLVSGKAMKQKGLKAIARIVSFADAEKKPEDFITAPALAMKKAVERAGLTLSDVDYFEINEAFSVVVLANIKLLGLDPQRVNIMGGAVSLGHPIGCSGARILVTLCTVLKQKKARYGCAGICNGGGGASAVVIENLEV